MKDYYSILEINENASRETIDKVYKLFIKKYHPDLQPNDKKQYAENKMKEINEAYEVLTNPEKKREYDAKLKEQKINEIMKEIKQDYQNQQYDDNYTQVTNNSNENQENRYYVTEDEIRRQAQIYYEELYRQFLYRNGYIKDYKQMFKNMLALILTIIVLIFSIYIMFKIPYFKNIFTDLMSDNVILKILFEKFI